MRFREQIQLFEVTFDIDVNGRVVSSRMNAPRIMLEQEFKDLVYLASRDPRAMKITMTRKEPVYNPIDKVWIEHEYKLECKNRAYEEWEANS